MWFFRPNLSAEMIMLVQDDALDKLQSQLKTHHLLYRDACGNTLLHIAIICHSHHIVLYLITIIKIDLNAANQQGFRPLHFAVLARQYNTCNLLLKHHAKINVQSMTGLTPFILATAPEWLEIAQLLLQHGADMTKPSFAGITPLYRAAAYGNVELINLLFDRGIDASSHANNGYEAICIAALNLHFDVVAMLERHLHQQKSATYPKASILNKQSMFVPFEIEKTPLESDEKMSLIHPR